MTREEFIKELDLIGNDYEIVGDKLVITSEDLDGSLTLYVETIPDNIVFNNINDVSLNFINNIPSGVEFKNGGDVWLDNVTSIDPTVRFNSGNSAWLGSLTNSWVDQWDGNIDDIESNRLFNHMINKGMFI